MYKRQPGYTEQRSEPTPRALTNQHLEPCPPHVPRRVYTIPNSGFLSATTHAKVMEKNSSAKGRKHMVATGAAALRYALFSTLAPAEETPLLSLLP